MNNAEHGNGGGYLVLLSSMHILHIIGGLIPLGMSVFKAWRRQRNPVLQVLYDADPESVFRFRLLTIYWHFIDGLWLYLYLFILANNYLL